ncbi:MAG TPA: restriction endonuclease subunit S [bacterium]|nr:restriction endonuclease subunit S [bacterium]
MAVYSIIKKSQLEGTHRLDAEYYQPEYLEINRKISHFNNFFLGDLIHSFASGKNLPQADNGKIFFLRTQNIGRVLINKEGMNFLAPNIEKYPVLNEGDILAVRVGEGVGNTSIVTPKFAKHSYSDNVIRFRIEKLDPYFIIIFLNSRIGFNYLERVSKGSARSLISSENIYSIRVPDLGQKVSNFCKKAILEGAKEVEQSESLYLQAEDLLLEELDLKNFQPEDDLSYIVNLSDVKKVHRADAEYFQPKYEKLVQKIKENKIEHLGNLVVMKKGIEPGSNEYQNEGKLFIRVSNMSKYEITDKGQKYLSNELYQKLKDNFEPKIGEILLTKDATPGIAYVMKEPIEGIISSGILRLELKEKDIEEEYLALCLNSIIGQMQAERDGGGSIITHWKPEQIKNLQIPILPKSTQQKITDLVRKSHQARKQAKQLLEQAKQKVEELIENSQNF